MSTRLEQLQKFYDEDPDDPFNIYGLALELSKTDRQKAIRYFEILLQQHSGYIPVYYHAAKLYEQLNERTKAIDTYTTGMIKARELNDVKALRELQSAYNEFIFE